MKLNNIKRGLSTLILIYCIICNAYGQEKFNAKVVFDSMYNEMRLHYPIFQERGIKWGEKYNQYSPLINSSTSQDSLFRVLAAMYGPINDFHIIFGTYDGKYRLRTWGWGKPKFHERFRNDSLRNTFWNNTFATLYKNGFSKMQAYGDTIDDRPLFIHSTSKEYAYLNITRCQLHELDSFPQIDKIALEKFIDAFLLTIKNKKGLIIDLRTAYGGEDEFGYVIASRFTNTKVQANFTRIFNENIFDSIEVKNYIEPKGKLQYTKPIVLLTNDGARSAADVFALAMKQLPHVTIIGENTFGSFGKSNFKDLGNDWYLNYPIEKFYSPQGQCLEGIGVPVNIKMENNIDDLINKKDKVIVKAINLIAESK